MGSRTAKNVTQMNKELLDKALCRILGVDPDMFHVDHIGARRYYTKQAIAICNRPCPIRQECYDFAYDNELSGVFGGTTTTERNKAREKERKRQREAAA